MILHGLYRILWLATWGNNLAAAELAITGALGGWAGRHRIGAALARWVLRHAAEQLRPELAAAEARLRAHITAEIHASRPPGPASEEGQQ